jgi:outer membrane lipoprotein-sorting protein
MFRVYSRMTSYQDEGLLTVTFDGPTGGTIEKMPFKTFFKRPNLFRFEWTDYGIRKTGRMHMIWFNGKEAFTYWEPDRYEKADRFSLAVAGATGITYRAVNTVSDLLLPDELGSSSLKRLTKISLLGEEVFDGARCYRIHGVEMDQTIELLVGKTDFFIRKLRRESKQGDEITIREEVRRNIKVNQPIPDVVFNYNPPIALTPRKDTDNSEIEKLLNPGPPVWTEFRSEEGRFTVLLPQKPTSQSSTVDTPQGRFAQQAFIATHDLLVCMVAYTDLPKQFLVSNDVDGFLDGIRDQLIKEVDGKLASETPLMLAGHVGRDIKVHVFQGQFRLRLFSVGDRVYVLSLLQLEKTSEETVEKFFSSFKLNPITKPVAALRLKQ